jgi:hypothetical protein
MKMPKSKAMAILIVALLTFSMAASITLIPNANAHTPPWTIPTYCYVNASPNPVGVGQPVEVVFWIDKAPPTAYVQYGDRWHFTVKITDPNGKTTTYGPYTSSDVGAGDFEFTPTIVGNYSVQSFFPATVLAGANPPPQYLSPVDGEYINDTYEASSSTVYTLTVQKEPIQPYPVTPLPTGYWQMPINGMNSAWTSISGDWLMSGYDGSGNRYNPYTTAPTSAHIIWTYPIAFGGVIGGNYTDFNYYTGLTYEAKFGGFGNTVVLMGGNLYFNLPLSDENGAGGLVSINLRTGKENWYSNTTDVLSFGQNFDYQSPNQFGIIPYLWSIPFPGSTYNAFDPYTGRLLFSLVNAQMGTTVFGPNGELLVYVLNPFSNTLSLWNSTLAIMYYYKNINAWEWRPLTTPVMNWSEGIQWTVPVKPYNEPGPQSIVLISDNVILATSGAFMASYPQNWQMEIGYSATTGQQLWVQNRTTPTGSEDFALTGPAGDGVYTEFHAATMTWYGYSLATGDQLWGPTAPYTDSFGMYSLPESTFAYGLLLGFDFSGYVHAYNMTTGQNVWNFFTGNSGTTTPYGSWPLMAPGPTSAGGEIFVETGHGYNPPLFPGAQIYCINATNGKLVWSELGYYTYNAVEIADGVLVCYNCYNGEVTAYARGPSATTVTAPTVEIPAGNQVLIQGTVTDQSPGTTCFGTPAAGTPAISDASMSQWMAYLYMQQPKPTNATGVTVTLTAVDPNDNTITLGTATSDETGNYALSWTAPNVPGVYTVTATFSGTNSYYASSAETHFTVLAAAPTAPPYPSPVTGLASFGSLELGIAAVVIVIIVCAAVLSVLMLRKKP